MKLEIFLRTDNMSLDNRVTIKDIAKVTHLSVATVSRILHKKGQHSSQTVKRVTDTANKMGYVRNTSAADLVNQKSRIVAVIVSNTKSNFSEHIIDAIESKAALDDLNVFILHAGNQDEQSQIKAIRTVIERAVMGIILVSLELDDTVLSILHGTSIPSICLSTSVKNAAIPFVTSDNYQMGYAATELMIKKGHTKIAMAGIPTAGSINQRIKGYLQCMENHHLNVDPEWIQYGTCTYADGEKAWQAYSKKREITCVICASDLTAVSMLNAITESGLKVPDDVSLLSFDGTEMVDMVRPRITSISQSFYDMGLAGIKFLTDGTPVQKNYLPFKVIERDSTRALK
ncbi:LacI family DNA-binding transcriptional regulator [Secundilactobacillus yichangensis]|uniref:LacI family DNA-binding transcriptional regulator n=1 Tax=Secundilactobacillus yichangensis TaxID=2799580 RepID=UPI001940C242|nr:LacI family DNA-binding transcriptional regulator [Secundilactobacillus yichangensis]